MFCMRLWVASVVGDGDEGRNTTGKTRHGGRRFPSFCLSLSLGFFPRVFVNGDFFSVLVGTVTFLCRGVRLSIQTSQPLVCSSDVFPFNPFFSSKLVLFFRSSSSVLVLLLSSFSLSCVFVFHLSIQRARRACLRLSVCSSPSASPSSKRSLPHAD